MDEATVTRSGFVAVLGRPNVGKSTLVNALVGEKVAIVSDKPQTTRHRIAGVVTRNGRQAVLLDLPGFQRPRDLLTEKMQAAVETTLKEVDFALVMLNAAEGIGAGDRFVIAAAQAAGAPVIIAINKIDLVDKGLLLPMMEEVAALGPCLDIFPVCSLSGEGLVELLATLMELLPEGPAYFPPEAVSDQPERVLVAELIREQVLRLTREEVPHAVAVEVRGMGPGDESDVVLIDAVILVERESQKGIIIGRGGAMIREIGAEARRGIEALLGSRVFIELRVKVRKKWRQDGRTLDSLGI